MTGWMARLLRNFSAQRRFNQSKMEEKTKYSGANEGSDDLLDALLRTRELPEPSPWFAARTLARLRNRQVYGGWRSFLFRFNLLAIPGHAWTSRRLAAGVCAVMLVAGVAFAGIHSQARRADQELTFAALEMAAQGESPVSDEETVWPEGNY